MASDMWTGWGIRTLSASNPAFNPYNYQTGSVWLHDNAIIALGFKRYGFDAEAAQVAHDISKAASYFHLNQLPEPYTAFRRDETTFPVQYIGANVPQAWAAGSAFMLTHAILGFMPDAPQNKLYVDHWLPGWLPDLTIEDVRIGRHMTIRQRMRVLDEWPRHEAEELAGVYAWKAPAADQTNKQSGSERGYWMSGRRSEARPS
jgi:glycogen debranching enzyme